ncbi:tyrosine-type recombinase/integrase [Phenylobacterium immobile]|uniref:tyrosine-type recombinase/integrase n=1 Tax=Phenylobacterium immobile TaxID=21 RepID=UPI000A4AE7CA|nr:tyrosine-type recombinase/integrase [Phenylobacterium immobile]
MKRLPFLKSYQDRHGKMRHYLRKPGAVQIALPGEYGSKEFMDAYWAACENAPKREIMSPNPPPAGSFSQLIELYYRSKAFTGNADITQRTYRNVLEKFRAAHGDKLVRGIRQRHVSKILEELTANAETWRKVIRIILNLAVERGWIDQHPMAGMRRPRKAKSGFRPWEEEDIAKFEKVHQRGSRERLALTLLLYTGQRRSDVVGMGRQHVGKGLIRVKQQKTGTELWIPLHPRLKAEIDAAPKTNMTLLVTQYDKPFTAAGFGNWFADAVTAAGLPEGSASHGLRKAAARRLAEAGCTPHQIMAVTGHKNLSEVTLYTASADQRRLAKEAMKMVAESEAGTDVSNPAQTG